MIDLSDHFVAQYRELEQAYARLSAEQIHGAGTPICGAAEVDLEKKCEELLTRCAGLEQSLERSAEDAAAKGRELARVQEELQRWQQAAVPAAASAPRAAPQWMAPDPSLQDIRVVPLPRFQKRPAG